MKAWSQGRWPRYLGHGFLLLVAAGPIAGCELLQPEVVVENGFDEPVQITGISFSGCRWQGILAPGESTAPAHCLPGTDRVHFKRFDAQSYFNGALDDFEDDPEAFEPVDDRIGFRLPTPLWYNYQTLDSFHVENGGFYRLLIEPDAIEQDFSVPGPYGH